MSGKITGAFSPPSGADADSIAMSNQIHSDLVRPVTCADVKRDLYDVEP